RVGDHAVVDQAQQHAVAHQLPAHDLVPDRLPADAEAGAGTFHLTDPQEVFAELRLRDLEIELLADAVNLEHAVVGPRLRRDHLVVAPRLALCAAAAAAASATRRLVARRLFPLRLGLRILRLWLGFLWLLRLLPRGPQRVVGRDDPLRRALGEEAR